MENNSIQPDEMERLLREAFLNAPDSETDKLTDMLANHAYKTNWSATPPIDKAQHFVAKKLFFKEFSLNFMIGAAVTLAIGVATYLLIPTSENKEMTQLPAHNNNQIMPAAIVQDTMELQKEVTKAVKPPTPSIKPKAPIALAHDVQVADTTKNRANTSGRGSLPPLQKPLPKRYILIPDISAQEAINNEKRKQEMISQLVKPDKKEWAFIPMGTTDLEGKPWSIQAFYMQTHEVSNIQYKTFLYDLVINDKLREYEKAAVYDSGWINISKIEPFVNQYFWNPKFDEYPVVNITTEGAKMYCDWLTTQVNNANKKSGRPYIHDLRIPELEEWIYAARGADDSAVYAWGGPFYRSSKGSILGNFQSGRDLQDHDGMDITAPVKSYTANPYGLYNMSGNVAEMTKPKSQTTMYIKGGAWNRSSEFMKILHKNEINIDELPTTNVGFRPVFTFIGQ